MEGGNEGTPLFHIFLKMGEEWAGFFFDSHFFQLSGGIVIDVATPILETRKTIFLTVCWFV